MARGYWPVAVYPKGATKLDGKSISKEGKDPIGLAWGLERWTEEKLRAAYERYPAAGAGICFGPGRGPGGSWLVDLEGDGPEAAESLATVMGGEIPETPSWESTRGGHTLFVTDGERLLSLLADAGAKEGTGTKVGVYHLPELPGLEWRVGGFKADGTTVKQVQSVVPPTPGTDGQPRVWRVTPRSPPAPLPESAYVYVERLATQKRTAAPADPPRPAAAHDAVGAYAAAALEQECQAVATATEGQRNTTLNAAAFSLGTLIGAGALDEPTAVANLQAAARQCGLPEGETAGTIRSGIEAGKGQPRDLSTIGTRQVRGAPSRNGPAPSPRVTHCASDADDDDIPIPEEEWPDPPDPAAYHGLAGEIVQTLAPQTEADPAALLFTLMVMFGNAIGRKPYARVGGTRHHANQFALLIGLTSIGRKGMSWSEVLPLFQGEEGADPGWSTPDHIANGLTSGPGVIFAVRDELKGRVPIKEKGRIVDYEDAILDAGVKDKRLLIHEPEFGGVLHRAGRESNDLTAVLRMAWETGNLRSLTKGLPYRATDAHISIIGHITPEELTQLLAEIDIVNGTVNRFVLCCSRRTKELPFGGHVPAAEMDILRRKLKAAVDFASTVEEVHWTRPAQDLWESEYSSLTRARAGAYGLATHRAAPHTLRFAMLYALMARSDRIGAAHLEAALALWDYAEASARHIFGDSTGDRDADRILEALRATPTGLFRSEIRLKVFGNNRPAAVIAAKLGLLLRLGLVDRESVDTGGRRAERWLARNDSKDSKRSERPDPAISDSAPNDSKNSESPPPNPDLSSTSSISSFSSRVHNANDEPPDREVTDWRDSDPNPF
jgi:hypothetical protein